MVEIPTYLRLVPTQGQRRPMGANRNAPAHGSAPGDRATTTLLPVSGDSVEVRVGRESGQSQDNIDFANSYLAERALSDLRRDLPELGQGVNDLHPNLDRRRVLALLAPLVDNDPTF